MTDNKRVVIVGFVTLLSVACTGQHGAAGSGDSRATAEAATKPAEVAAKAQGLPDKAGDPAANDAGFRADAIANGIITSRKACDLLTRPDAEVAVGQPLPQNTVNVTLGMCDYNAADFSAGASITVGAWESIKGAATSGKAVPASIGGVGDEALNLNGGNGSTLYVRKGAEGFLLSLNGPKIDHLADRGLAAEKSLALKILGRW